jgi:hypothetical protein
VCDFAVLTLRGVDTTTATNFDRGAYLGADGALLPVEAALTGLGPNEHRLVRDKLAAMMAAEAMLPQPPVVAAGVPATTAPATASGAAGATEAAAASDPAAAVHRAGSNRASGNESLHGSIHARAAAARAALALLCDLTAAFDKGVLSEEEFKAMRAQSMADTRM